MKISKLFHWLYAILMFLPFGLLIYNALASLMSGQVISTYNTWFSYIDMFFNDFLTGSGLWVTIDSVYDYLCLELFGMDSAIIVSLLTYWTSISIIWLVFDTFMYVPLLVHRWIDKAKLE